MTFTQGGFTGGSAATSLMIYQPSGGTLATSIPVGVSTNTVDTTAALGADYVFEFANLALDFHSQYLAIFVDRSGEPVGLGLMQGYEGNPGIDNYHSGGAVFDFDAYGVTFDTNADFSATFALAAPLEMAENVPVLGSPLLGVLALLLFAITRGVLR